MKQDDINIICLMAIEDEAKRYNVSKDEMVIFMMKYYKSPTFIQVINSFILLTGTVFEVYYLPGFDQEKQGVAFFILLIIANCGISYEFSCLIKKIYELDNFDFFIMKPYKKVFDQIITERRKVINNNEFKSYKHNN